MRARLAALALFAGIMASSCSALTGRCGERQRDVMITGRIPNPADPEAGYSQVVFVERETTDPRQTGYWLFIDESLRGKVNAARLRRTDGTLMLELETRATVAGSQVTYEGQLPASSGSATFTTWYELAASNQLMLVIRTSLAGRDSLSAPLRVASSTPWAQPHCS